MFNLFKNLRHRKKLIKDFNSLVLKDLTKSQINCLLELKKSGASNRAPEEDPLTYLTESERKVLIYIFSLQSIPDELKKGARFYYVAYFNKYENMGFSTDQSTMLAGIDWLGFKIEKHK